MEHNDNKCFQACFDCGDLVRCGNLCQDYEDKKSRCKHCCDKNSTKRISCSFCQDGFALVFKVRQPTPYWICSTCGHVYDTIEIRKVMFAHDIDRDVDK